MTKAYLVLGPESSGTRFVTQLLLDAGCFGDGDHEQRLDQPGDLSRELLDESALPDPSTPIVWRHSCPHGGQWVDISKAVRQLQRHGYEIVAVVTQRDWYPMLQSQRKEHAHVTSESDGLHNIRRAYRDIFAHLPAEVPFVLVSYEALVRYQHKAVRKLLQLLQLSKLPSVTSIRDGNAKWYAAAGPKRCQEPIRENSPRESVPDTNVAVNRPARI